MKKSSLLSLLTAGAILVTTAGTYALWDKLDATSTGNFTVPNSSIKLDAAAMSFNDPTPKLGVNQITYTSTATFTITGELLDKLSDYQMALVPTVKKEDGTAITTGFTVAIKKDGVVVADNIDKNLAASNTYTVEVIVDDEALAGAKLDVSLTGTISAKNPA